MEGVYATLALVGAVTGYGFTKAKKQSFQKYVMSSQELESTAQAGQEIDALAQASPTKRSAYDYLLRKLPEFVRTKATKTLASFNQSKESGAPPSVAYSNLRLALLSDRELGNITANQELYFPKREVFYKWFREGLAAPPLPPGPVTPESARQPRSASQSTERSASQFSARTDGWGGEESPVPQSLMTLETKRDLLQRLGITNRPTFVAWAESRRQTQPERVREIEGYVNEVFPVMTPAQTGWAEPTGLWAQRPPRIAVPETPEVTPAISTVTVPPPAPAPAPTQGQPPQLTRPTAAESSALAATVPPPAPAPESAAGTGLGIVAPAPAPAPEVPQGEVATPLPTTTEPVPEPAPAPAPLQTVALPPTLPPPSAPTGPFPVRAGPFRRTQRQGQVPGRAVTQRVPLGQRVQNMFRSNRVAPESEPEFSQINPMFAPAPAPAPAPVTATQRQRPSLLSRLRRVTLRAPRITSSTKKDAAKLTELGITDVDSLVSYLQGKSSTEQLEALRMVTNVYPQDADVFFDAAIDNPDVSEAFQRATPKLRSPIDKAVKKARKTRPAALVTAPAALSALTSAPPTVEEAPVELDQVNPMFAPTPAPAPAPAPAQMPLGDVQIPPHMRGIITMRPTPFAPAPAVTVPPPAPTVTVPPPPPAPEVPREGGPAAGTGLGIVPPPSVPEVPVSQPATPLPTAEVPAPTVTVPLPAPVPVQAKTRAATRKATQITNLKQWLLTTEVNDTTKAILKAYIEQHPGDFASIYASLKNTTKGKQFLQEYPDITADLVALRQLQQLETQGTIPQQVTPEEQALLSQIQTPQDELEAVLSAPTPPPPAPTVTVPPPAPSTPPPAPAPVPPNGLTKGEAQEWLRTNLGITSGISFKAWMRENTSKVTDRILDTATTAYPDQAKGLGNYREYYAVLTGLSKSRATTQRRGGRKARKNTLRRRPKVNTKNVRRTSHRKNRAKRTD